MNAPEHSTLPPGSRIRGKKTIAKEALYKAIHAQICTLKPHFNIGISTGSTHPEYPAWFDPYTHWRFVPKGAAWDDSLTKARKEKSPTRPT